MSPRERRVLSLGGAVVLVAFVALRLAPWGWRAARMSGEELRARAALLARARAGVEEVPRLQDSSVVIQKKLVALAPRILAGGQEADAMADLSGRINAFASTHRVRLSRTDPLADSTKAGDLRRVSVRVALEGDSRGTLEFLLALSRGSTVLVIGDLRISAPNATGPDNAVESLESEATVSAWYLARKRGR